MRLSFFPAYIVHPPKIRFADQEEDEDIELLLRQHWVTNVGWITYSILASLLPLILINSKSWFGLSFLPAISANFLFASITVWYLLITAYIIESFLHWYFNIYIVTNLHIIDIDFENLLSKRIQENGLEEIESTAAHLKGIVSSFFNYGDVVIQTAAHTQESSFLNVPYPTTVVDRINDLARDLKATLPHPPQP